MYQVEAVITCIIIFTSFAVLIGLICLVFKLLPQHAKDRIDKIGEPKYIEVEDE